MTELKNIPMCLLHVLLARDSRDAVIIRRGPSKLVQLILWDRAEDKFEHGQWFKGRVFEWNSDLSPSGRYLVYHATKNKYHTEPAQWTAISRPPYFTALALWSAGYDDGGGIFENERTLTLGCLSGPVEGKCNLPADFVARTDWKMMAIGRPNNILILRMQRDGWTLLETHSEVRGTMQIEYVKPVRWSKPSPSNASVQLFSRWAEANHAPWQEFNYQILDKDQMIGLGALDWADWDINGDLLFANSGKILRLRAGLEDINKAVELIDLTESKFQETEAPQCARSW